MPDTILDDVNTLLLKEVGDRRILEQIRRAAENNEVISIYERNYIAKLKGELESKPGRQKRVPSLPYHEQAPGKQHVPQKQILAPPPEPQRRKGRRRIKIAAAAGAALAVALAVGALASGPGTGFGPAGIAISADEPSYSAGDIISISGKSDVPLGDPAILSIENPDGGLAWTENVNPRADGEFSTLAIAGGAGWEAAGTYTLIAAHGNQTASVDFDFGG